MVLARLYAARGAHVGLVARRLAALDELIAGLPGGASHHMAFTLDVTDARALREAAQRYIARFGLPDVVIANAGIAVGTLTEELDDLDAFEAVLRTNVMGMFATFQPFVAGMRARGSGRLVGISSVAGIRGLPGAGAYSASKAAATCYLESLRIELHGSGVKVVDIRPGYIATPMTAINPYPMPFILQPDEAARRFVRVIDAGKPRRIIPWQMAIVGRTMALLPCWLHDFLFARALRKPRGLPL